MVKNEDVTTIQVRKATAARLKGMYEKFGDKYDIIINRLIDFYEQDGKVPVSTYQDKMMDKNDH